jgi:hypothetical protein
MANFANKLTGLESAGFLSFSKIQSGPFADVFAAEVDQLVLPNLDMVQISGNAISKAR